MIPRTELIATVKSCWQRVGLQAWQEAEINWMYGDLLYALEHPTKPVGNSSGSSGGNAGSAGNDGSTVWLAFYEPSTTGWDHECTIDGCASLAAARQRCEGLFRETLREQREACAERSRSPFEQVRLRKLFESFQPGARRSPFFRGGRRSDDADECNWYCSGEPKNDLGVGCPVRIYRQCDYTNAMDGCGNPEMEEMWWAEPFQVSAEKHTHLLGAGAYCALCGRAASAAKKLKLCTGCKKVSYCDRQCQKLHWKGHRRQCK